MITSLSTSHRYNKSQADSSSVGLSAIDKTTYRPPLHLVVPEGQLQVHTAPYRGSFSGVLRDALRAAGLGRKVMVAQFLKGGVNQGPQASIHLCGKLEWIRPSISFRIAEKATEQKDRPTTLQAVKEIWETCKSQLLESNLDQLVLDEVGLAISLGYLQEDDVINTLEQRPTAMDVILTGPSIPSRVISMADQVTELRSGT